MSTIDKILLICSIFITVFIVCMIVIFCIFQTIPDTLVTEVLSVFSNELIITFVIWWLKKKKPRD